MERVGSEYELRRDLCIWSCDLPVYTHTHTPLKLTVSIDICVNCLHKVKTPSVSFTFRYDVYIDIFQQRLIIGNHFIQWLCVDRILYRIFFSFSIFSVVALGCFPLYSFTFAIRSILVANFDDDGKN